MTGALTHEQLVKKYLPRLSLDPLPQEAIPRLAKDQSALKAIQGAIREVPTRHAILLGDARGMSRIPDESVHLVVTSPPYFDLKKYPEHESQLGALHDYDVFLKELDRVWADCYRVLVKGGRLVVVVGDVCRSRRAFGAHMVVPLHASIMEHCRYIGFHNLATVVWHKISNAVFEVENGSSFLGKPYEPNSVIKNDMLIRLTPNDTTGCGEGASMVAKGQLYGARHCALRAPEHPVVPVVATVGREGEAVDRLGRFRKPEAHAVEALRMGSFGVNRISMKNDIEFILMQRKPGAYRRPTEAMRVLSVIGEKSHKKWSKQVVTVRGASTRSHPAPYPAELVEPLVRMFSFVGDTVLDPFSGTGTTSLAAMRCGRNSIGIEIEPSYHMMSIHRLKKAASTEGLKAQVEPMQLFAGV